MSQLKSRKRPRQEASLEQATVQKPKTKLDFDLIKAVQKRDVDMAEVERLLKAKANPNISANSDGDSLLGWLAAQEARDNIEVITALLKAKANLEASTNGFTPLIYATYHCHFPAAYALIIARAKIVTDRVSALAPEARKVTIVNLINWGIAQNKSRKKMLIFLGGLHARTGARSSLTQTQRFTIFDRQVLRITSQLLGLYKIPTDLLSAALITAIEQGKAVEVQWLLTAKADAKTIKKVPGYSTPALILALQQSPEEEPPKPEIVKALLEAKADPKCFSTYTAPLGYSMKDYVIVPNEKPVVEMRPTTDYASGNPQLLELLQKYNTEDIKASVATTPTLPAATQRPSAPSAALLAQYSTAIAAAAPPKPESNPEAPATTSNSDKAAPRSSFPGK